MNLTKEEKATIFNRDFFLHKVSATKKIMVFMEKISPSLFCSHQEVIMPPKTNISYPRITKGEYYYGFPYVVMDYPSFFSGKDIFLFRTICWFANGVYFSLILSSREKETFSHYLNRIDNHFSELEKANIEIGGVKDIWDFRESSPCNVVYKDGSIRKLEKNKAIRMQVCYPLSVAGSYQRLRECATSFLASIKPAISK